MGFAYDDYILISELEEMTESARAPMLVRAIGLTEEQAARYADILTPIANEDRQTLNYDTYVQDVASRREQAVSSFEASGSGFTATITLDRENLVFFSVPYDEGFTATVNGVETEIEYVSGGMCAVLCPAGENTIVFTYMTPVSYTHLGERGRRGDLLAAHGRADLRKQPRIAHRAASDGHAVAPGLAHQGERPLGRRDVAVRKHRHAHGGFDLRDLVRVDARLVHLSLIHI